ncbi:universal stress protein [Nakamurella silvestris]|nr:universal stress protein [Nakamurella silvestris]
MSTVHTSRIVVGIDGSTSSLAALRWALRRAAAENAAVDIVHCWKPQTLSDAFLSSAHELHRASMCMVQNEIAAAVAELGVTPEVHPVSERGNPTQVLLERAAGASCLVLGAHEQFRLKSVVFGQVVRSCLRNAMCPVVVIDRTGAVVETGAAVGAPE